MMSVEPRLNFVTLVVRDLDASRRFYVDGLGWPVEFEAPGDVIAMIRVADTVMFSLWQESAAVAELGQIGRADGAPQFTSRTMWPRVPTWTASWARLPQPEPPLSIRRLRGEWGGYSGYFADPDGFRWEVACNPGPIGQSVL